MTLIKEIDFGTPASKSEKMVTLTIDGIGGDGAGGYVDHAGGHGGRDPIPKLCATDMLDSFGSCRLCLVEVEGRNGTPASCTTPVAPGISVLTQTPRLKAIRKGVMELYISDHPLDCLTCPANGDCELRGHGRRRRPARGALRLRGCRTMCSPSKTGPRTSCSSRRTPATRTSPTILRSASSATAASARARKCRARLRSRSRAAASTAACRPA